MTGQSSIMRTLFGWLPNWVGFCLIMLAGILAIIFGAAITPSAGLVAIGVAAVASSALAWWSGGKSTPNVDPFGKSFGGTVEHIDGWVWLVVFGLFVIAVLIKIFVS